MARPLTPLGALGEKVESALADDGGARARAIESARRGFAAQLSQPASAKQRGRASFVIAALAAASLGVVLWLSFLRRPGALAFDVNGTPGVAQTWLAAPSARALVVSFSDGTVLDVQPSSRARVVDTDQHGADIALESGAIHARVVHTSHSAWRLIAGPFAIRVTGTRFDVTWDPSSQKFSLAVLEGSVVVSGSIVGSERPVRAGERLAASVVQGQLELRGAETAAAEGSNSDRAVTAPDERSATQPDASGHPAAAPSAATAPDTAGKDAAAGSWRELAKSGDLRKAFAAAEAGGFQSACDSASSSELLLLGDAARLAGRADRASVALLALRQRFPHDPRRAAAAFALGKVAFDQKHAYAQAAEWFATCVREQPGGALAREASGRRVEALQQSGDDAGAQRAARDYLTRYPDGPHADLARSLLK